MKYYKFEFISAVFRTRRFKLKLDTPVIDTSEGYFSIEVYEGLKSLLYQTFPEMLSGGLAFRCADASYFMKPVVEKYLNTEAYLTIGYFTNEGKTSFHIDDTKINEILLLNDSTIKMRFHVWLTLPSLEVIDFTIFNTLKDATQIPISEYLFTRSEMFDVNAGYHPVLIGEDFLRKSGYLKDEFQCY